MRTEVAGILYWENRFLLLGNESAAQEAADLVKAEVERSIKSFEEQNLPDDLCGDYARAAFNYYAAAAKLGVEADGLKSITDLLWNQCAVRFQITIDYELNDPEPGEVEKASRYGTVTCYIPHEEFLADLANASVKGNGSYTFSDDYVWVYNPNEGWKKTLKKEGTGTVTCTGSTSLTSFDNVYPAESYVWKASITLTYEGEGAIEVCDTKYDEDPGQDSCTKTEYTENWFENYSAILNGTGATLKDVRVNNEETGATASDVVTLQWLNRPGFESSDDGKCY